MTDTQATAKLPAAPSQEVAMIERVVEAMRAYQDGLIGEIVKAPTLEGYARAAIEQLKRDRLNTAQLALEDTIERLSEALTPSAETKAAYIGKFSFGIEVGDDSSPETDYVRHEEVMVPWTTIKEIMATIKSRALTGE